jgi:hypothetical protein
MIQTKGFLDLNDIELLLSNRNNIHFCHCEEGFLRRSLSREEQIPILDHRDGTGACPGKERTGACPGKERTGACPGKERTGAISKSAFLLITGRLLQQKPLRSDMAE